MLKASVLIIDDSESLRKLYSDVLSMYGYQTATAVNGEDALLKIKTYSSLPDLILLDLEMPVKDGREFRKAQLQDEELKDIPVLLCSASVNLESISKSMMIDDYLQKPTSIEGLIAKVESILNIFTEG